MSSFLLPLRRAYKCNVRGECFWPLHRWYNEKQSWEDRRKIKMPVLERVCLTKSDHIRRRQRTSPTWFLEENQSGAQQERQLR